MARYTLDLTDEVNDRLIAIASSHGLSKAEALRRALSLLSITDKEQRRGNSLAVVREDGDRLTPVAQLVGVF